MIIDRNLATVGNLLHRLVDIRDRLDVFFFIPSYMSHTKLSQLDASLAVLLYDVSTDV